ncbi:thioesterase superfamily protein [Colletotrichum navitas]|uniref:Thioesterase superfamily protein n=1 Tax=Colletotrichum navitas TaxID=681940 RepID=A0AAD8V299_9PEZI|nr:thioesterase superfamily protein [Colletotrichum navitas]KAK1579533.1 thioesterase superfamily protein [Colletotrichum navitas]
MTSYAELKQRRREDYRYMLDYRTRWADNDMYQHMNNSIYNFLYDSVVNTYLIEHCRLSPAGSKQHGVVVHSHSDYFASISFPAVAELALRVNKLGKSSVTYEIALFEKGVEQVRAVGEFVQVFVERSTGRPTASGMTDEMRRGLERIQVVEARENKL